MKSLWTSQEVALCTDGELHGRNDLEIYDVTFDSKLVTKGSLFLAMRGETHDGHNYIDHAISLGASVIMLENASRINLNDRAVSYVSVENTHAALEKMALFSRKRTKAKVIAVTGSFGKTSTKEWLSLVFNRQAPTYSSRKSYNNFRGVPLSLSQLPRDDSFGIFEVGGNHRDEITPLSLLLKPDIVLITNIGSAHIENFKDMEDIAYMKSEIFAGLESHGTAVLNKDTPYFSLLESLVKKKSSVKLVTTGFQDSCDVFLIQKESHKDGTDVVARVFGEKISYRLSAHGEQWVINSLNVLALGVVANLDIDVLAKDLALFTPVKGRGEMIEVRISEKKSFMVMDESYNAAPDPMKIALNNLGSFKTTGRRIAVLGDMYERGSTAIEDHTSLCEFIEKNHIDRVYTSGEMMGHLYRELPVQLRGAHDDAMDTRNLSDLICREVKEGDLILVKGSRGPYLSFPNGRMSIIVEALKKLAKEPNSH